MAVKVCLDAGHYGKYNRSPAVSSYYESDMTWKLHNYLKKELESFGIVVVTTRTNQNTDRALYERGAASKGCKRNADLPLLRKNAPAQTGLQEENPVALQHLH